MAGWRRVVTDAVVAGVKSALRPAARENRSAGRTARPHPGDLRGGDVRIRYAPRRDGKPDPGEVVWGWVPFEEDPARGKDRPVLVVSELDGYLIALMLTSRDHDLDATEQARAGRHWMDVGAGDWDRRRRPSEVRLDRVLRLNPDGVRREGGRLPKGRFEEVAAALRDMHGWS